MRPGKWILLSLLAGCVAGPARAQTGYPMLLSAYPTGCRRGATTDVTVRGSQNLAGTYAVLFEKPGLTATVVPEATPPKPGAVVNTATIRVVAAADAPLGPQEFRLITPRGASSVAQLVVGSEPEILEKEPNNLPAQANPIQLPVTVNGEIQAGEDVDSYRFHAKAGQDVVFSCLCARLQHKIHDLTPGGGGTHTDPILVLTDTEGREIATADDYYGPDPLLIQHFDKEGDYLIQIRDVRYMGMSGWTYRLTCTEQPFVTAVYPMAGERGKPVEIQPVGYNLGGMKQVRVEVPMREPGPMDLQLPTSPTPTNPMPFVVSDLPQVLESGDNDTIDHANPVRLPCGINGRIEKEGDVDSYRFAATKGQAYTFEVFARRYDSSLDSFLRIVDLKGNVLTSNDDVVGKDSRIDWTCPADGEYVVQINDLNTRGGDTYVYYLAATLARPDFTLASDDDKAMVEPGGGYAMYVIATRRNGFAGEIRLSVENLPPGVTATADRIPANMTQGCVIFHAAPGAKPDFRRIRMWGTADIQLPGGKTETVKNLVVPEEEIYFPGGGRGRYAVDTHVVSVTDPSDVLLKVSPANVELKPGGTATIDVDVVRQNGYDKNVVLDVILRHLGQPFGNPLPPGVTMDEGASKTLLGPKDTHGKIVLKAAADAPAIEKLPIAVLGQISINFVVKVSHAGDPVFVTVKK